MKEYLETPVFLTFFVKHHTLEKVFNAIREVKPKILFLVGDGPRKDCPDDIENIKRCKDILANVDWECDVHRYYAEENRGILVNGSEGINRAFEIVDRIIFLEDDMLPSKFFFYYCEELLEKYKDDTRILRISGINFVGIYEKCDADYFLARQVASGACAFWKRSYDGMDRSLEFLEDKYVRNCMENIIPKKYKTVIARAERDRRDLLFDGLPKSSELKVSRVFDS